MELLHVQEPLPPDARRALGRTGTARYHARSSEAVIDPLARALTAAGVKVRRRTELGRPAERIAARAERIDADLVVMGSHGRTALAELWLGSVTQGVLARCSRPLFILRGDNPPVERELRDIVDAIAMLRARIDRQAA